MGCGGRLLGIGHEMDVSLRGIESERRRTTNIFFAIVTVIILLNAAALIMIAPWDDGDGPPDDGDDGPTGQSVYPWEFPAETENITTDATWTGRTGILENPIVVEEGATLRIVDSHIKVMLEDLILWRQPAFRVEEGGSLEVDGSTIEIFRDPRLEKAVVGPIYGASATVPYISRPVNLKQATDPVLHLDLAWMREGIDMGVGVYVNDFAGVELLEEVNPVGYQPHDWIHVSVPLEDYIGQVPIVVVFPLGFPLDLTFIGDVRVVDGDGPPPGDAFPTGDPIKDGWRTYAFIGLDYLLQKYEPTVNWIHSAQDMWQELIRSDGDVTISSSEVLGPSNLARNGLAEILKEAFEKPEERHPHDVYAPIEVVSSQGGHIRVDSAKLTVTDSVVEFVPVIATEAELYIDRSSLTGDCDILSLREPRGTIESTDFVFMEPRQGLPFTRYDDRLLWALGVEGSSPVGPLEVTECSFTGAEQAIDLSYADIRLDGCHFSSIQEMAIWDHASVGLGPWEQIKETNVFTSIYDNLLLRTQLTEVHYFNSSDPDANITFDGYSGLRSDIDLFMPIQGSLSFHYRDKARHMVPTLLVHGDGRVETTEGASTSFNSGGVRGNIPIAIGQELIEVDISAYEANPFRFPITAYPEVHGIRSMPNQAPGVYMVKTRLYVRYLDALNLTMDLVLDGGPVRTVDLETEVTSWDYSNVYINQAVNLTTGFHELELHVWGNPLTEDLTYAEDPVMLGVLVSVILVLNQTTKLDMGWLQHADFVILEGDTKATVDQISDLDPSLPLGEFTLLGGIGSSLNLKGINTTEPLDLTIFPSENASLHISNSTINDLYLGFDEGSLLYPPINSEVRLDNISCHSFRASYLMRRLLVTSSVIDSTCNIYQSNDTRITFKEVQLPRCHIDVDNSSLYLEDCTIDGDMTIEPTASASVGISSCTILNSFIAILLQGQAFYEYVHVVVTGNTFAGDGAVLYVGSDLLDPTYYDDDVDFVHNVGGLILNNTFSGEGSMVVLHHGFFGKICGPNTLGEGGKQYAMYVTRMQVIPPESSPSNPGFRLLPHEGIVDTWPLAEYSWFELDGVVLYDVSEDPSMEMDPPVLDVLLLSHSILVRGFGTVDPIEDSDEATFSELPEMELLLVAQIEDWPWPWPYYATGRDG